MPVPYTKPARRPLQIFGLDPMIARTERRQITLEVANELLEPGPQVGVTDTRELHKCHSEPRRRRGILLNQGDSSLRSE